MGDDPGEVVESNFPVPEREARDQFWYAPWAFVVNAVVGTFIFAVIAAVAVCLDIAVRKLGTYGVDGMVIYGLKAAEDGLFGVDLLLFGIHLWRTAKRTIKRL